MPNRGRNDPYKGFNFRVAFGAVLAAVAGLAVVKKLMPGASGQTKRKSKGYVSEVSSGSRPIEGVGTSVAAMPRSAPKSGKKRATRKSTGRKTAPKKSGGGAKRR
jgi:hypothetical protein